MENDPKSQINQKAWSLCQKPPNVTIHIEPSYRCSQETVVNKGRYRVANDCTQILGFKPCLCMNNGAWLKAWADADTKKQKMVSSMTLRKDCLVLTWLWMWIFSKCHFWVMNKSQKWNLTFLFTARQRWWHNFIFHWFIVVWWWRTCAKETT